MYDVSLKCDEMLVPSVFCTWFGINYHYVTSLHCPLILYPYAIDENTIPCSCRTE